jgi:hypothetical protein
MTNLRPDDTLPTASLLILFMGQAHDRELQSGFIGRYKGSILGSSLSLLRRLLVFAMYTVVFSVAFWGRWAAGGVIARRFFAEPLNRATVDTSNPKDVKKAYSLLGYHGALKNPSARRARRIAFVPFRM